MIAQLFGHLRVCPHKAAFQPAAVHGQRGAHLALHLRSHFFHLGQHAAQVHRLQRLGRLLFHGQQFQHLPQGPLHPHAFLLQVLQSLLRLFVAVRAKMHLQIFAVLVHHPQRVQQHVLKLFARKFPFSRFIPHSFAFSFTFPLRRPRPVCRRCAVHRSAFRSKPSGPPARLRP